MLSVQQYVYDAQAIAVAQQYVHDAQAIAVAKQGHNCKQDPMVCSLRKAHSWFVAPNVYRWQQPVQGTDPGSNTALYMHTTKAMIAERPCWLSN